jgi:hypothetical protein
VYKSELLLPKNATTISLSSVKDWRLAHEMFEREMPYFDFTDFTMASFLRSPFHGSGFSPFLNGLICKKFAYLNQMSVGKLLIPYLEPKNLFAWLSRSTLAILMGFSSPARSFAAAAYSGANFLQCPL